MDIQLKVVILRIENKIKFALKQKYNVYNRIGFANCKA